MTGRSGAGRGGRGRGRGRGRQGRRRRSLRRACAGARVRRLAALQQSSSEDARAWGGAPPERLMPRTRGSSTPPKPKLPATDNPSRGVPPPQARPAGPRRPRRHTPAHAHQWKQKSRSLRVPGLGTRYGSHASSSATSSSKSTAMAAQGRGRAPPDCALLDSCSTAAPPATSIRLDFRLSGKKKKDIGAAGAIQSEHPYSII